MHDGEPRDEIVRLEERIEELAAKIENCRKIALASRIAIALGVAILFAIVIGAVRADPVLMTASLAALLGGFVLLGSNSSTAKEAAAQMAAAEEGRAELIGQIELRTVGPRDGARTLH